jgi:hypothetical protein
MLHLVEKKRNKKDLMSEIHQHLVNNFSSDELQQSLRLIRDQAKITQASETIGIGRLATQLIQEYHGPNNDLKAYLAGLCLVLIDLPSGKEKDEFKQRLQETIDIFYKLSILGRSELMRSLSVALS